LTISPGARLATTPHARSAMTNIVGLPLARAARSEEQAARAAAAISQCEKAVGLHLV